MIIENVEFDWNGRHFTIKADPLTSMVTITHCYMPWITSYDSIRAISDQCRSKGSDLDDYIKMIIGNRILELHWELDKQFEMFNWALASNSRLEL